MNRYPHEGRISTVLNVVGKRWLLISIIVLGVMVVSVIINYFFLPRAYEAKVKFIYPLKRGAGFIKANLGALDIPIRGFESILEAEPTVYNHIAIIQSRTVSEMVVDKLDLTNYYENLRGPKPEDKRRQAARFLRMRMTINDSIKGAVVISIRDRSPRMAADMANAVVDATSDYLTELYQETQGKMTVFLRERSKEVDAQLADVEDRIRQKKEETGILAVDTQAEQLIGSYAELEKTLAEVEIEYRASLASLNATEGFSEGARKYVAAVEKGEIPPGEPYSTYLLGETGKGAPKPPQAIAKAYEDLNVAYLRRQLSELELQLATKRLEFTDEHPEVKVLKDQVIQAREALNEELTKFYDAAIASLEIESIGYSAQVDVIHNMMNEIDKQMAEFPAEEKGLIELEREKKVRESVLLVVEQELEESEIREQKLELPFTVLDEAIPPRAPVSPRLIVNTVISGAIAAWIMLYITFWQETRRRRKAIGTSKEVS